jgi:hypothetical protein
MNPLDRLSEYLRAVEKRLRMLAWTRGAAIAAVAALVSTIVLVLIANSFAFSSSSMLASRTVLFLALALALGGGLLLPLLRLNGRRAAREAEEKFPEFEQRLLTFSERSNANAADPFLELLAADTLEAAGKAEPARVTTPRSIFGFASLAASAVLFLVWLGMAGPGFWSYGTSLLWAGPPKAETHAFYDIIVQPGDRTVRRKSDQLVTARMVGFTPQHAKLFARYGSAAKWEEAAMRPQLDGPNHEFLFSGIPESLEYYVEAGPVRSKTYKLNVIDLPSVKKIRVTYHYPTWSGMKEAVEDPGGDLRAVEGTTAELAIQTDRPLPNGIIILDDETRIPLKDGTARVPIQKDGMYHIASVERGAEHGIGQNEDVRLTDDYFIEAKKDSPPTVRIRRPGRDAKANPIEEVTVEVEAEDDFGLREVSLVYSVNGAPEKSIPILKGAQQKTVEGKTMLSLEDFKLAPGDIVSLYAVAKDARNTSQTDMFFIEAQPYEREYTQSQQGGGGGGGEGDEAQGGISKRQKEIITATFNQIKDTKQDKTTAAEAAKFLADVQSKLRDQAKSLAARMKSRELSGTNQEFQKFAKDMETAVEAMGPAADNLRGLKWRDALAPEQKALQYLLRAESTFRQIQVAFGRSGGGGGGGGSGRDLENLFDLELDTEKNQYENGQQQASADQRKKEIDEALQKLEQLAKRQQELADQQKKNTQTSQQRWQQEMLRREAEQLQHKMEQLSRSGSQQQGQQQQGQQQGQQSQSGQPSQSGQGGQSGQQRQGQQQSTQGGPGQQSQQQQQQSQSQQQQQQQAMRQRLGQQQSSAGQQQLDQAIERLKQAQRDMQNSASSQANGSAQSEAEARRAAERLQEARDLVSGMRKREGGEQVGELARKSEELASRHQDFSNRLRKELLSEQASIRPDKAEELAGESEAIRKGVEDLEKQMQAAARDLAATDKDASSKIRKALGDVQQDELVRNMRQSAELIRRPGYGGYAVMRQAATTQSLNNLRDKLKELEAAGVKGGKPGDKGLQQALEQAETLRRQMEQVARGMGRGQKGEKGNQPGTQGKQGQGQPGQQQGQQSSGQGQPGQMGQNGQSGQSGQQPGQSGQQSQQGGDQSGQGQSAGGQSPGGQRFGQGSTASGEGREAGATYGGQPGGYGGMNRGQRFNDGGGYAGGDPAIVERGYRESLRDLSRLRENLADNPDIARDVQDLMRDMQRIDPRRLGQEPLLMERINAQIASLEQIELQLRRKVEEQQGGNVRSGASDPIPPGYANAIYEYRRKLSKEK